jgi:hypothetical protein
MAPAFRSYSMDRDLHELEYTVGTEGWKTFVALMREGATRATEQLLDPSKNRKDKRSDDFLRGYIKGLRDAVRKPTEVVERAKALEAANETDYHSSEGTTPEEE